MRAAKLRAPGSNDQPPFGHGSRRRQHGSGSRLDTAAAAHAAGCSLQAVGREERLSRHLAATILRTNSHLRGSIDFVALGVPAGEFDAANCAILRVRADRRSGVIEARVEDIMPVLPRAQPVIDDQCDHSFASAASATGKILAPRSTPGTVPADSITSAAPITPLVAHAATGLVSAMIGGSARHSRRERKRRLRLRAAEKLDCFVKSTRPLFRAERNAARQHEQVALKIAAQLFDVACVERGILTCEIHLANNRAARRAVAFPSSGSMGDGGGQGAGSDQKGKHADVHYGNYKQTGAI